jgi:hypothetical protein
MVFTPSLLRDKQYTRLLARWHGNPREKPLFPKPILPGSMKRFAVESHYFNECGVSHSVPIHPMTENPLKRNPSPPESAGVAQESALSLGTAGQRNNVGAISTGLDYLLDHHAQWDCSTASDFWVGACVVARLGELPAQYINSGLRSKIETALNSLARVRFAGSRWGSSSHQDAELTARTIVALRAGNRELPAGMLQALGRCRQADGGFALSPEDWSGSAPEITVTAIQALRTIDRPAEDFLTGRMQSDENHLASWLQVCAGILDWDKGLAPLPLLNQACRLVVRVVPRSAFQQALLLRCLVRLRLQQAWVAVADLRAWQLENGSWPGPAPRRPAAAGSSLNSDVRNVISTVTAVSALALCESQPGLYFGSDLPRPRRLYES